MAAIRVLIVDDSTFFCMATIRGLAQYKDIETIGYACDAYQAKDKILQLKPDVLTLDINMPRINGLEFLDVLMREHPMPVIVVSGADGVVFEAIKRGAVDFVAKSSMASFLDDLAGKIRIAAMAKRLKAPPTSPARAAMTPAARVQPGVGAAPQTRRPSLVTPAVQEVAVPQGAPVSIGDKIKLIAIGASTGGTEATSNILKIMSGPGMPDQFPGMVITQHMPPVFTRMYAERLNRETKFDVKEAVTGDRILPNRVLIAPGDAHMTVVKSGTFLIVKCAPGEKVSGHCPSVNVMFSSVASQVGASAIGVILTGMGADGATGILEMRKAGAFTIGQNAATCVVYGMPMEAYNIGAISMQSGLWDIPQLVVRYLK